MLKTHRSMSSSPLLNQILEKLLTAEKKGCRSVSRKRLYQFESLEERIVLSADPSLIGLPTEINILAGSTYHVGLDGEGSDNLTYTIRSAENGITSNSVLSGNKSIKLHLVEYNEDGSVSEDFGYIIFELFEGETPETAAHIKQLVEMNFYDGLTFHRIIEDFMIQGGCPNGDGTGGSPLGTINDEFNSLLSHNGKGYVSMANSNGVRTNANGQQYEVWNTGDCQFFITDKAVTRLDRLHTIFGFVTQGEDIRDRINSVDTDEDDIPLKTIKIVSAEVIDDTQNGVLRISTDTTKTGQETLIVTVKDAEGNEQEYEIKVNVVSAPNLSNIDDIEIKAGESKDITLPDLKGLGQYVVDRYSGSHPGMSFEMVGENTLRITADATVSGLQLGTLIVDDVVSSGQYLYVFVTPAAPNVTLTEGDTGTAGDGVTSANNANDDSALEFTMDNIIPQATITLTANGREIPYTVVNSEVIDEETGLLRVTIRTVPGGDNTFTDGEYVFRITQTQRFIDQLNHPPVTSDKSTPLTIRVVSQAPRFLNPDDGNPYDAIIGEEMRIPLSTNQDSITEIVFSITSDDVPEGMRISEDGKYLIWTPQPGQVGGEYPVTITATNGAGFASSITIQVLIQNGPQFVFEGETTVDEEATVEIDLKPSEGDETEGEITYTIETSNLPEGAEFTLVSTGEQTAKFTWNTTEADAPGIFHIVIIATDSEGKARRKTLTITVSEVNQAPYIDPIDETFQATEHELFEYTVVGKDDDLPANVLTYSLVGDNIPEGMTINPNTGKITWTPNETHGGHSFTVQVKVTDEAGESATVDIEIAVEETDDPPIFDPLADLFRFYDDIGAYLLHLSAKDPDVPTNGIRYSLEGDIPEGMVIDPETGIIEWNIPAGYLGQMELTRLLNITVKATEIIQGEGEEEDTEGLFTLKTVSFEIVNRNLMNFLSSQNATQFQGRPDDTPKLPEQVVDTVMQRREVNSGTTFSLDHDRIPVNTLYSYFSPISFGFDGFSSGMPTEELLRILEEEQQNGNNSRRVTQSAFKPISPDNLLRNLEHGVTQASQNLLNRATQTVEKGTQIVQAVFEHYESNQEMELARNVIKHVPEENQAIDHAISDLVVENRMTEEGVPVKEVSKDEFQAAMKQVKMMKK